MSFAEDAKRVAERLTGIGRPSDGELKRLLRTVEPQTFSFKDDGETPNNPALPMLYYPNAVALPSDFDPAAVLEKIFDGNGWSNGIFDFLHFHTQVHEVLGIARGHATVRFGGGTGCTVTVKAGDVVVLPAGTGHQRVAPAEDLLVVGAYPPEGRYDQQEPGNLDHDAALARIRSVAVPGTDPVYGPNGPLRRLWTQNGAAS
ncbi:Uncharacterized protein YjlB [Enhydrobacter aerosaccus]|uniref:Uncharacterized protein YjlB n=1 Tax=Enhydrobacter aerosaccus TaxID=225324 RepID=A0A1T4R8L4_9HYPH|nr:cupin [Enhydrobacter aerosaccus]SKA12265.1 Uncharacterized protein YjlB [Enhydrobacter aerosaccus]